LRLGALMGELSFELFRCTGLGSLCVWHPFF
jgi:hypothetical protein